MFTESMAGSSKSGVYPGARFGVAGGVNIFRDAWQYRITDSGLERLNARKGASPAFLSILAIARAGAVSFAQIARQMPKIAGDDLELWLSAMCTMGLLSPVEGELAVIADEPAEVDEVPAAAQAAAAVPQAPAGLALLVHADAKTRALWRRALTGRGFELLEASDLETVEDIMRERRPTWVVLGLKGEDFDGLHLLRALKRPRAPRISRVCIVVPRGVTLSPEEGETAARADATAGAVPDIVRALCGDEALEAGGEAPATAADAAQPTPEPAPPAVAPGNPAVRAIASPGKPPANAPVWMNLLYGDAYRYGTFETDMPSDLESQYPRLLVRMIENWRRPEFAREINNLIMDDRGDRNGFPPEVMDELWFLNEVYKICNEPEARADGRHGAAWNGERPAAKPDPMLKTSRLNEWMSSHKPG